MRPANLRTKLFLDSGDPAETKQAIELLGFLDGQTTNPSLFAKNTSVQARLATGKKFTKEEIYEEYKQIIQDIRKELPYGSISIEVYADEHTTAEEMITWGREMNTWIDGAHIKLPTIPAGLAAAQQLTMDGINVNMTLVFSEYQAAAVHVATMNTAQQAGQVYLSPFIGRLDDIGQNGMDLIEHCLRLYQEHDVRQVEVLAASIRTVDHLMAVLALECDNVTVPLKILKEWVGDGMPIPDTKFVYTSDLEAIPFQDPYIPTNSHWRDVDIEHMLTTQGLAKFAADWNALLQ